MWRGIGLVALVVITLVAIACGGGGDEASSVKGCPVDLTAIAASPQHDSSMSTYTLTDAQERVYWLKLPADPPQGAPSGANISALPGCNDSANWVTVGYRTDDYMLSIMGFPGTTNLNQRNDATPVTINGVTGDLQSGNGYEVLRWRRGGLTFEATARLGGVLTHERFLEILESIPE